mgnify:CR=1 FL=1
MMNAEYTRAPSADEFHSARDQFEAAITWLKSEDASKLTHSALEERLEEEGRELMRQLFQAHLDLRAVREERLPEVRGCDGQTRNHVRESDRALATVLGVVRVRRLQYGQRGVSSLFPGDVALNLPEEVYSHGLRRVAAMEASKISYQETVSSKTTPPARSLRGRCRISCSDRLWTSTLSTWAELPWARKRRPTPWFSPSTGRAS